MSTRRIRSAPTAPARAPTFAAAAFLSCTLLGGCLINSDSSSSISGRYVSEQTLSTIEAGKTSDYVTAVLGEPSQKNSLGDGTEIWKWHYSKSTSSKTAVIFLIGSEADVTSEHTTFVELKDGVVVKAWRD